MTEPMMLCPVCGHPVAVREDVKPAAVARQRGLRDHFAADGGTESHKIAVAHYAALYLLGGKVS